MNGLAARVAERMSRARAGGVPQPECAPGASRYTLSKEGWRPALASDLPALQVVGLLVVAMAGARGRTSRDLPVLGMPDSQRAQGETRHETPLEIELDGFRILRNDRAVADAAMSAIGELAEHGDGYHRVPLTDALIAAAAAEHGGVAVLHRDTHFTKLAEVLAFENVELPGS